MSVRELSITYGPLTFGGTSTTYLLDGFTRHQVSDGKAPSSLEFDLVVVAGTAAAFRSAIEGLELIFRTPRLTLGVVQSGHVLLQADHDDAEGGFNTEPEIVKVGQIGDSGRSRRYRLRVRYETPADTATTSGLRESNVTVSYDPARIRTVRYSGVFTAVSGTTSARARYEAAISALAASLKSALSITTWELVEEPTTEHDYDDKVLRFERVYRELVFGQGSDSATDDADIIDQSLTVSRREFSEERSPNTPEPSGDEGQESTRGEVGGVRPLAVFDLRYECSIDATSTTDLRSKYAGLRGWLLSQFSGFFSQGKFALTQERPQYDRPNNRISVDLTAEGPVAGTNIVRRTVTQEKRTTSPHVFRGAWTGNPLDHYIYQGHEIQLVVTSTVTRSLSPLSQEEIADGEKAAVSAAGGGGGGSGFLVDRSTSSTKVRIGIEGSGHTLDLYDTTTTVTMRKVNRVGASGGVTGFGSGSGGLTPTHAALS